MPLPQFKRITWKRIFAEGEKRIKRYLPIALARATTRERNSILAQREGLQLSIHVGLKETTPIKLKRTLKNQMQLLMQLIQLATREK